MIVIDLFVNSPFYIKFFNSMEAVEKAHINAFFNCFVRYQGEEGWAPAMFLKRVDSGESSTSAGGKSDTLDIVSFNGGMLNISLKL